MPNTQVARSFEIKSFMNFSFFSQMAERSDELVKRKILLGLLISFNAPVYVRNETFLYAPLKLINKAMSE